MGQRQTTIAVTAISFGGGLAAGGAVHNETLWFCGPPGLMCIVLAYTMTTSSKQAAMIGWTGGFAYFLAALPFLLVGYDAIGITGPKPVLGVAALYLLLSMWWPVAFALAFRLSKAAIALAHPIIPPTILACLWGIAELLRSQVFPAIPVAQIASIVSQTQMVQLSRFMSVELLGVFLLALACCAAFAFIRNRVPWASLALFAGAMGLGLLASKPIPLPEMPKIATIDTTIPQAERWNDDLLPGYIADLTGRTRTAFDAGADLVVWPEVSVPFFHTELAQELDAARPPQGAYLALGLMTPIEEEPGRFRNSIIFLDSDMREVARYDKNHLFPFGEYIPFAQTLQRYLGMSTIATDPSAMAFGSSPSQIALPGLPGTILAAICYEGSYAVSGADRNTPGAYIINVSNDAWWQGGPGGRFVEQEARLRAIEAGLPLIRVPNMHPAARFDARGNLL
jgi:apolipoprotein N-acyltransferase